MIFVTVGTHEQQFNRLIKAIDQLKKENIIEDEVFIQSGYSDYQPQYCEFKEIIAYDEMENYIKKADIVVTHGGPASFMKVLSVGKSPVVVPRQLAFQEHVNNHQLDFVEKVIEKGYPLKLVRDIKELRSCLAFERAEYTVDLTSSNNLQFCQEIEQFIRKAAE
ncbi:MAG: glycosyltransferase [Enterococcus sp.]